ncbi:MAG: DNA topoisomerase (ATP-hydrolyzing) subunit B [bacterium]
MQLFQEEQYDANQIEVLEGLEAVRLRPGMYIGSTGSKGLHHMVWEVVDNSIDEFLAGQGDRIKITINKDNSITVEDWGRGIPVSNHAEMGIPAAQVVLTTLHAGGKFNNSNYKFAGGLHGVGISVVNALSEWLELTIYRNGKTYTQRYEKGIPKTELHEESGYQTRTGTVVTFKADETIFDETEYKFTTLETRLQESAFLNRGLQLELIDKRKEKVKKKEFSYSGGIKEFIVHLNKNHSPLHSKIMYAEKNVGDYYVELAVQYNKGYTERIFSFANNINTVDGGYHLTGFKTALTRAVNNFAKENNLLNKKIPSLPGKDIREGITAIINVKLSDPQFEGQTKTKLGNSEIRSIVESPVYDYLKLFFESYPNIAKSIVDKACQSIKARNASKKARELTRKDSSKKSSSLPGKLADCTTKKPERSEIFLVEGDSAGGSAKQGRDRYFQAILPLKGKIMNVERANVSKILSNKEVISVITVLGCGIGEDFNLNKLRYHKIIIMTDADVDGLHISTLILTLFYRYMPELIKNGHIYLARPPLYKVVSGNKEKYLYSDNELEIFKQEQKKKKFSIQRYKGLGEMNPKQLWTTTMDPANRQLQRVEIEDEIETDDVFNKLMGNNPSLRKDFIFENANMVGEIDI